jgi:hypothetical protein
VAEDENEEEEEDVQGLPPAIKVPLSVPGGFRKRPKPTKKKNKKVARRKAYFSRAKNPQYFDRLIKYWAKLETAGDPYARHNALKRFPMSSQSSLDREIREYRRVCTKLCSGLTKLFALPEHDFCFTFIVDSI